MYKIENFITAKIPLALMLVLEIITIQCPKCQLAFFVLYILYVPSVHSNFRNEIPSLLVPLPLPFLCASLSAFPFIRLHFSSPSPSSFPPSLFMTPMPASGVKARESEGRRTGKKHTHKGRKEKDLVSILNLPHLSPIWKKSMIASNSRVVDAMVSTVRFIHAPRLLA